MNGLVTHHYNSEGQGPHILVLGAVHGNEVCGPEAIRQCMDMIDNGTLKIARGSVTFVPVCNPLAWQENKRVVNLNLNRVITKHSSPSLPEHDYANEICDLIGRHDVVLDIHSFHDGTMPFLFLDRNDQEHREFANALPFTYHITDWPSLYEAQQTLSEGDTIQYAHAHEKTGILIECGQHEDPDSVTVAKESILASLAHFGLISAVPAKEKEIITIKMKQIVIKPEKCEFIRNWRDLDVITKGEPLAKTGEEGAILTAPFDGYMIIPFADAPEGAEWFYLGSSE